LQEARTTNPLFRVLLRKVRKRRRISARRLAREVGIDPSYVSKIESGAAPPPAWNIMLAISRFLDSPELLEASEHAFLRHVLFLTSNLLARLGEAPPTLVTELGADDVASWKNTCSQMLADIDSAYSSRLKWEDIPPKEQRRRKRRSASAGKLKGRFAHAH